MKIIAIIPCRYQSKRFPGKSLALINKYPMMWHVYNQTLKSRYIQNTYIATDDKRIYKKCQELSLNYILTKKTHLNGTDRIAECAKKIYADIYVNVQGDEPLIDPKTIDKVVKNLIYNKNNKVLATNAYHVITNKKDIEDKNVVKTIIDKNNNALAFSRNAIPFSINKNHKYYRQIGLYAFTKKGINLFSKLKSGILEKNETVEMYRITENGFLVNMVKVNKSSKSVDTKNDLRIIKKLM